MAFADLRNLTPGPYGDALDLANKAKFTETELQAYEKARDEIRQVHEIAEARWAEGKAEGKAEGRAEGKAEGRAEGKAEGRAEGKAEGELEARRQTLLRLLGRAGIALTAGEKAQIDACTDAPTLDRWIDNVFGAKTARDALT